MDTQKSIKRTCFLGAVVAVIFALIATCLLTACAGKTEEVTVRASEVLVEGPVLNRGDQLTDVVDATELTGAFKDKYYRAKYDGQTIYVQKTYVRLAGAAQPEPWTGYAAEGAIVFATSDFTGDDIQTLPLNEEVTVLDEFGDLLFVRTQSGFEGYIQADKISHEQIEEEPVVAYSYSYGGTAGSHGFPNHAPYVAPAPPANVGGGGGADGSDIQMPTAFNPKDGFGGQGGYAEERDPFILGVGVAYADEPKGEDATVLKDKTPSYLVMLNRGDTVQVKGKSKDGMSTIVLNGKDQQIPSYTLIQPDDPAYDEGVVYALEGAKLYSNYQLTKPVRDLAVNEELLVVDEITLYGDTDDSLQRILIVQIGDEFFYLDATTTGNEPVEVIEEAVEEDAGGSGSYYDPGYYASGSGSGGSSAAASAPEPSGSSEELWTPPAM